MTESDYLSRHTQGARDRAQGRHADHWEDVRRDRAYHAAMDRKMDKWLKAHPNATMNQTLCAIMEAGMDLLCPVPPINGPRAAPKEPYIGLIDVGVCWPPLTRINFTSEDPWS